MQKGQTLNLLPSLGQTMQTSFFSSSSNCYDFIIILHLGPLRAVKLFLVLVLLLQTLSAVGLLLLCSMIEKSIFYKSSLHFQMAYRWRFRWHDGWNSNDPYAAEVKGVKGCAFSQPPRPVYTDGYQVNRSFSSDESSSFASSNTTQL